MAHPSQNRPSMDMRIQIPTDDEVVKRFLDGQPPRARSAVMRQLIHIFVAEHGDTDVFSVAGSLLAAAPGSRRVADSAGATSTSDETNGEADATETDAESGVEVNGAESGSDSNTATTATQPQSDAAAVDEPAGDDDDPDQTPDISEMFA